MHRSRIKSEGVQITRRNENIKETNSIKFLGIIVDNKLKWREHIIYIKNKVSRAIGIIYKAREYANKQTVKQMYYTFVFPYLIYCCEIWGNTSHTYLDPLIKWIKLSHHDWHLDMNHLAGKVRLKNQQKSIYSKSCQDIIELCEIRDGLSSCDTLSNDDICKIIDIICIE